MSRLGKKPLNIPEGVNISFKEGIINISGKNGSLNIPNLEGISPIIENQSILFKTTKENIQTRMNLGTIVSLIKNAMEGVQNGFEKKLKIEGVGYKVAMDGKNIVLNVGFSHPVKFEIPEGIVALTEKNTISIKGINKELVGQTAAKIRKIKKPEPYKGKGIMYVNEVIRRKAGKKASNS